MEDTGKIVVFKLGGESYGVSINNVNEIIEMTEICTIPQTPRHIEGMVNIRGVIHVIFNMRTKFGMEPRQNDRNTKIIIASGRKIGFIVDEVSEIVQIEKVDIENPSAIYGGLGKEYIDGIAKPGGSIIVVLNLDRLLSVQDEKELDKIIKKPA